MSKPYSRIKLDAFERRLAVESIEIGVAGLEQQLVQVRDLSKRADLHKQIAIYADLIQRLTASRRIAVTDPQFDALKAMLGLGSTASHRVIVRKLEDAYHRNTAPHQGKSKRGD